MSTLEFLGLTSVSVVASGITALLVLRIRLRGLRLLEKGSRGVDDATRIQNTLRLLDEFQGHDYTITRAKAWRVHEKVLAAVDPAPIEPLVRYMDGKGVDQQSVLAQEFPFDDTFSSGLSAFQSVARVISFWEKFWLQLELGILHQQFLWPLTHHYDDWRPFFERLIMAARAYYKDGRYPSWVRDLESLDSEWMNLTLRRDVEAIGRDT